MSFQKAHQSIQKSLWMYAKSDYVGGTLRAILNAARLNNTITAQDIGTEAGKKRTLKVNYLPPACDDDGTCTDNVCSPGLKPEPTQTYFTLNQCTASKVLTIAMDDMRDLDNIGANQWAMALLNQRWATVRRKLEIQLTAILLANRGVQPDGSASKLISLVDPNTGQLRPNGIFNLERAFIDAELNEPYVIGSAPVYDIERLTRIGTGNSLGQNIGEVATRNWYYDKNLNGAFGNNAENLIAFDPQLIKFMGFNFNMGRFATDTKGLIPEQMFQAGPDWLFSTITDPATGLLWDLDVIFDKCNKTWNFQFRINWDLFTLPMNVCGIQGLNGIMHFTTCAPAPVDCPVDGQPSGTLTTAKTYQYDPGFTYPLIVNEFTLDGHTFRPKVTLASDADLLAMFNQFGNGGFTLNGANVQYSGYSARSGVINATNYAFTPLP
jgi:hypothetical protein